MSKTWQERFDEEFPKGSRPEVTHLTVARDFLKHFISNLITQTREETIKEVLNIELAPDTETIKMVDDFRTKYEAFGYGQGWVMRKVEALNKLKK
jgi:hypothetical protein